MIRLKRHRDSSRPAAAAKPGSSEGLASPDAELLARARRRDMRAHAEIFDTWHPAIYRYVRMRVSDAQLAEDLSAEVFTRFLEALHRERGPRDSLRGWLFGVASNCIADHQRRQYRDTPAGPETVAGGAAPDPEAAASDLLQGETLAKAVQQLTDDQQQVIALRFGAEMKIRDVALTLGKSEAAVKQLQARAVARLAGLIGDLEGATS